MDFLGFFLHNKWHKLISLYLTTKKGQNSPLLENKKKYLLNIFICIFYNKVWEI